jgi:hypothetical protein
MQAAVVDTNLLNQLPSVDQAKQIFQKRCYPTFHARDFSIGGK